MSYLTGIDLSAIDTVPQQPLGAVGTVDGGKEYRYYKYVEATAAVPAVAGEVAFFYLAGGTNDGFVTSDLTDSVNVGAGVLQSNLTDGTFGWLQTRGPATLTIALTAGADGNALTPVGSTDGSLDVSAAVTDHICAIADDISEKEIICMFPE